jgi:hypothetical protein
MDSPYPPGLTSGQMPRLCQRHASLCPLLPHNTHTARDQAGRTRPLSRLGVAPMGRRRKPIPAPPGTVQPMRRITRLRVPVVSPFAPERPSITPTRPGAPCSGSGSADPTHALDPTRNEKVVGSIPTGGSPQHPRAQILTLADTSVFHLDRPHVPLTRPHAAAHARRAPIDQTGARDQAST